jgi:hypothetical protein
MMPLTYEDALKAGYEAVRAEGASGADATQAAKEAANAYREERTATFVFSTHTSRLATTAMTAIVDAEEALSAHASR